MKTFGLFMFLILVCTLVTFNIFKEVKDREIQLMTLSMLMTYIFYKLIKEESKDF
jgi:hypothetical protein